VNILVTGGAGYIGSHAHRHLLNEGHKVSVLDDLSHGHSWAIDPRAAFYSGRIQDSDLVKSIVDQNKIEAVMHFAAFIEVGESVQDPEKYYRNNFSHALQFLHTLLQRNVKKFIFSSTAAVYGNPVYTPIDETHPCVPINPYGRSKRMFEMALEDLSKSHALQFIALRYFNVAGACPEAKLGEAHDPETHLIPRILRQAYENTGYVSIFGTDYDTPDGTCIRDYVHVEDLVSAHRLALMNLENRSGSFYNIGSEKGFSVREVLAAASKIVGRNLPFEEKSRRMGDPSILVASRKKIVDELKWTPKFSDLHIIVEHAWKWHRSFWAEETLR
jgi:UDP-glucose 4-epimerase